MHAIFLREHNRIAKLLKEYLPPHLQQVKIYDQSTLFSCLLCLFLGIFHNFKGMYLVFKVLKIIAIFLNGSEKSNRSCIGCLRQYWVPKAPYVHKFVWM